MNRCMVILGGCGTADGSEINETVCVLLALSQHGIKYQCFAPDADQYEVYDHYHKKVTGEKRNMLVEAARIVRGEILPLETLDPSKFDGLIIPGGSGIAKNLFTYKEDGINMKVNPDLERVIKYCYEHRIPIGAMCIAPMVLSKVLKNIIVTLGNPNCGPAKDAEKLGARIVATSNNDIAIDDGNYIFTVPCFMLNAELKDIYNDANKLVRGMNFKNPNIAQESLRV